MVATAVGVTGAMAATIAEVRSAETATGAPVIAAGVGGTGVAWARRTAARVDATAGLLEEDRTTKTREEDGVATRGAHPPILWRRVVGTPSPGVNVVQPHRRQVPFLVDVASSTERLKNVTICAGSA